MHRWRVRKSSTGEWIALPPGSAPGDGWPAVAMFHTYARAMHYAQGAAKRRAWCAAT